MADYRNAHNIIYFEQEVRKINQQFVGEYCFVCLPVFRVYIVLLINFNGGRSVQNIVY